MRSNCLIFAFFLSVASARRIPISTAAAVGPSPRAITGLDWGQPYYPFGWGLDDAYFGVPEEFQIHETGIESEQVKEVNRQVKQSKPSVNADAIKPPAVPQEHYPLPGWFGMTPDIQSKARGWFRSSHHSSFEEIEKALEGLE